MIEALKMILIGMKNGLACAMGARPAGLPSYESNRKDRRESTKKKRRGRLN